MTSSTRGPGRPRIRKDGKRDGRGTALPDIANVGAVFNTLRLLEVLYDNQWRSIGDLAVKTALAQQTVRRTLEDMEIHGWIEKTSVGNGYRYHIAPKAFTRPAQAAITHINNLLEDKTNDETE